MASGSSPPPSSEADGETPTETTVPPPFTPEQQEWIRQLVAQRTEPTVSSSSPAVVLPVAPPMPARSLPPPGNVGESLNDR